MSLATPLDRAIPFLPWSIFAYLLVFPAALLPVFVVRSPRLFRRTIGAYALAIVFSLAIFALFPVTSLGYRAGRSTLDPASFADWCVLLVYRLDPPVNLFPSLHLSIAGLAAGSAWKARRAWGVAAATGVAVIFVSICTVKQHFVLDGIAGTGLAAVLYLVLLRPFEPRPGEPAAGFSARGPIAYLVFQALVYVGLFVAFALQPPAGN